MHFLQNSFSCPNTWSVAVQSISGSALYCGAGDTEHDMACLDTLWAKPVYWNTEHTCIFRLYLMHQKIRQNALKTIFWLMTVSCNTCIKIKDLRTSYRIFLLNAMAVSLKGLKNLPNPNSLIAHIGLYL